MGVEESLEIPGDKSGLSVIDSSATARDTGLAKFGRRAGYVALLTAVSLFLSNIVVLHFVVLAIIAIVFAFVTIRRAIEIGSSPAQLALGLIPGVGWLILAAHLSKEELKVEGALTDSTDIQAEPKNIKRWRPAFAFFVACSLIFSSFLLGVGSLRGLETGRAQSHDAELTTVQQQTSPSPARDGESKLDSEPVSRITAEDSNGNGVDLHDNGAGSGPTPQGNRAFSGAADESFAALVSRLTIEPEALVEYDRALFHHWIDANGNGCNTRREVLIAESLSPVSVGPNCTLRGGSWVSRFDGQRVDDHSFLDIDHFVPLAEAWRSGAHAWDDEKRELYANDLEWGVSLNAVSALSNRAKGDRDPASWVPPSAEYRCEYIYIWVQIKVRWELSVDQIEFDALNRHWSSCDGN